MGEFKGGENGKKENIETFNNIESYTLDNVKNFGESEYLKGYYYTYSTSLDSDTLTKTEDSFEIENNEELLNDKNDKSQSNLVEYNGNTSIDSDTSVKGGDYLSESED